MLFEDLFFAFLNLKSDTTVEVMKGDFSERLTAEACLEKYGDNEVIVFAVRGSIIEVVLMEKE